MAAAAGSTDGATKRQHPLTGPIGRLVASKCLLDSLFAMRLVCSSWRRAVSECVVHAHEENWEYIRSALEAISRPFHHERRVVGAGAPHEPLRPTTADQGSDANRVLSTQLLQTSLVFEICGETEPRFDFRRTPRSFTRLYFLCMAHEAAIVQCPRLLVTGIGRSVEWRPALHHPVAAAALVRLIRGGAGPACNEPWELRDLHLDDFRSDGVPGIESIVEAAAPRLRSLRLSHLQAGDSLFLRLAAAGVPHLESLAFVVTTTDDLVTTPPPSHLTDAGLVAIGAAVAGRLTRADISVRDTALATFSSRGLGALLGTPSLTSLRVEGFTLVAAPVGSLVAGGDGSASVDRLDDAVFDQLPPLRSLTVRNGKGFAAKQLARRACFQQLEELRVLRYKTSTDPLLSVDDEREALYMADGNGDGAAPGKGDCSWSTFGLHRLPQLRTLVLWGRLGLNAESWAFLGACRGLEELTYIGPDPVNVLHAFIDARAALAEQEEPPGTEFGPGLPRLRKLRLGPATNEDVERTLLAVKALRPEVDTILLGDTHDQ